MAYNAVVVKLENVRKHPGADRLQIAQALGYQVIVGMNVSEGDIGIAFPEGGQIDSEFLIANNLYRKHPQTNEPMGGFFESTGRVKALRLRGVISDCFFIPIKSLDYLNPPDMPVGTEFDRINGMQICKKYTNPSTQKAINAAKKQYKKPKWLPRFLVPLHQWLCINQAKYDPCPNFYKHFETSQLRSHNRAIEAMSNVTVYFHSKLHGTSGRTGYVKYKKKSVFSRFFSPKYCYVTGSRNVTFNPEGYGQSFGDSYYSGTNFRQQAHNIIKAAGLKRDEILYYEIVGYSSPAATIMPSHTMKWEDFKSSGFSKDEFDSLVSRYGEVVSYTYGCSEGAFDIYVYRIVQNGLDLPWIEVEKRCTELNLKPVPLLETHHEPKNVMDIARRLSEEADKDGQLREGVCLRVEKVDEGKHIFHSIFKAKSHTFAVLEGIQYTMSNYVDIEAVS
jgi:hypothetical protein